ncbi:MAG: TIGR01777 family protein, partial [Anaerolineaceae bacterium]|nr:TIGR01777 family protein [Anaerolineaceae bacterium]
GWDGRTTQGWGHLASEVDAIVNLAGANIGERRWTEARKRVIRASRVDAGKAIVAAVEQSTHRPALVIQIAGVGYYGPHGDEPLDEQSPPGKDYLASVAADWENATKPVTGFGVRLVTMRTGVVLTRQGGVLAPFLLQQRLFAGGPLGSGKQWISWIHMQDLMNCFLFFLEQANAPQKIVDGVFNVTSPEPVTNAQFGKILSRVLKRPYWLPAPAFILRLVLGEMSTLVLDGQRVLPQRLLEMGFAFQYASLRSALENLLK